MLGNVFGAVFYTVGFAILFASKSAIHEIEAGIAFVVGTLWFVYERLGK